MAKTLKMVNNFLRLNEVHCNCITKIKVQCKIKSLGTSVL